MTAPQPASPGSDSVHAQLAQALRASHGQLRTVDEMADRLAPLVDRLRAEAKAEALDEPLHEVECPSCGATIRARMADAPQPDGEAVRAARACWCAHCEGVVLAHDHPTDLIAQLGGRRFIVCRDCGDKRCPRAAHHDRPCAYREPCPVYSHGVDGWHCAVTGDHEQHTNAAGDVTW